MRNSLRVCRNFLFENPVYCMLLAMKESSINNITKLKPVTLDKPKTRGSPPKHFLFQNEKDLSNTVKRILPKTIANSVIQKRFSLFHLYGLSKTPKKNLTKRAI